MAEQSVVYIECPNCECAVRKLDATACPNCSCCVFCGRKLKPDDPFRDCAPSKDPDFVNKHFQKLIIPEDQVARETRRMEIRKQLEDKKFYSFLLFGAIIYVCGSIFSDVFGLYSWNKFSATIIFVLVVLMPLGSFIQRIFRKIEDHRLQLQDDLPNEARDSG